MRLRVGIVGTGAWARRTHAPALKTHPAIELVGVWGRDAEKAREFAAEFGIRAFESFAQLLADVDVVDLAVSPMAQVEFASRAAAAGRHLFMEKPLSMRSADGERLARIASDNGVIGRLYVARIFDADRQGWLSSSALKQWTGGHFDWKSAGLLQESPAAGGWRAQAGPLFDVAPHIISQLEIVLGEIHSVTSATADHEGVVELEFAHDTGKVSTARIDLRVPVTFTRETISLSSPHETRVWANDKPTDFITAFHAMVTDLLDEVQGRRAKDPVVRRLSGVAQGVRVVRLIEDAMSIIEQPHNGREPKD